VTSGLWRRRRRVARGLLLSLQLLSAHRLRTTLSISGLFVGVAAVIVMVAVGEGAERRVATRLQAMGTNLLVVSAAPAPRLADRPRQVHVTTLLRAADADLLRESPRAVAAAPVVSRGVIARWEGRNAPTTVTGTTPEGLRIRNISLAAGRAFDDHDEQQQARVALVGPTLARSLFGGADPVGQVIRIGAVPFDVVGVTRARGVDPGGADMDDVVLVPFATAARRVLNVPYVHAVFVEARSSADLEALEADVRQRLHARLGPRTGTLDPFVIQSQATLLRTERGAAAALQGLVGGVALLALVVGGIGILAVMLISVRERTREIGLRRALGAKRRDIHLQFIMESTMLASAGGAAGVLVGAVAAAAAAWLGPWDLVLTWPPVVAGLASSMALGLAVGALPAARAARLEPIRALRAS
jgi:putative ABC transport system permease protein